MAYPVHFHADYQDRASRLTTFFRVIMLIPHVIVLFFYTIPAIVLAVIAWFAILFIGRYPRGMFRFQVGFLRYATRVRCYGTLLTDRFPPFGPGSADDDYPIRLDVDEPERLSRLTTFFRWVLILPAYVVAYVLSILESLMAMAAWFIILFIGRLPRGMFEVMELPQRYNARYTAYGLLLITDGYPWFQPETDPTVPDRSWEQPLPPLPNAPRA